MVEIKLSTPDFGQFCDLSDNQKEARNKGIGGSDAAAVMKQSRYRTPLDVYKEKLGADSSFKGNMRTAIGSFMEDFVREMVSKMSGINFIKPHKNLRMSHSKYPWMRCNLDLITKDKQFVGEIKVVAESDEWGEEGTDFMPTEYLIQCVHNRYVAADKYGIDYQEFHMFVLIMKRWGDPEIRHYIYKKNVKLESNMIRTQEHFWINYVEKEIAPPFFTLKEASSHFDSVKDESVLGSDIEIELYEKREKIIEEIKDLKIQEERVKTQIAQTMCENTTLLIGTGMIVTWKPQTYKRLDSTRLKSEMPELYQKYTKTSQTRPMRFMRVKMEKALHRE